MSGNSINTRLAFELNGGSVKPPVEWTDIELNASFDNENIQPNITIDSFRFVNQEAKILRDWITSGYPGIFEGVPFNIKASNNISGISVFNGYVNLSDDVSILENGSVISKIVKSEGLNSLDDRLNALTWGYLESIGVITQSDYTILDYVVEKKINLLELLISNVVLFLMIKELIESINRNIRDISGVIAMTSIPLGGQIGALVWAIALALINIAYSILLLIAIIDMSIKLFNTLVNPVRQHRLLKIETALTKVAAHLGYNFVSPITELNYLYFLPSNPRQDNVSLIDGIFTTLKGTPKGIPNVLDYGYGVGEFFGAVKDIPYSKYAIIGNELHLRPVNDPFWIRSATYQLMSTLIEEKKFNTQDLKTRFALLFRIDQRDDWTFDNYTGTSYEVVTDAIQVNNSEAKYLKGLNEIQIPWSLGNRKDDLNAVENTLLSIAQFIDDLTGIFGGGTDFASLLTNKIGVLKVSDNSISVPKVLYLVNKKIPANHRSLFSAKIMYQKYWNETSFVANNFKGQREVYLNVKIPFGLNSFNQLINNSYAKDQFGDVIKIIDIKWRLHSDYAIVSYWKQKKYTPNLIETFIEAS
jgi:hypothetical protein